MRAYSLGLLFSLLVCSCAAQDTSQTEDKPVEVPTVTNSNVVAQVAKKVSGALISSTNDVLRAPRVHFVTFQSDANIVALEQTLSALASSEVWAAQTLEYGVGPISILPTISDAMQWASEITSGLPTASPNADVEAYLLANLGGSTPRFGSVDANDIFILALPPGIAASPNASVAPACAANVMAWHSAVSLPPSGLGIPYIVVPSCPGQSNLSTMASQSVALVQTLVAAATNPRQAGFGMLAPAFAGLWLAAEAPEAPHICAAALQGEPNFVTYVSDMPYPVAKTWSNSAFLANQLPCVPNTSMAPYLTATPQLSEVVALSLPGGSVPNMLGVLVLPGSTNTIQLLLGDGNNNLGTLTIAASELGTSDLSLSLSQTEGIAGDIIDLTVGLVAQPSTSQHVVQLVVSNGTTSFRQFILVRQSAT